MLLQLFLLVIDEPTGGFSDTPTDLARQLRNLMKTHCARSDYARRMALAFWFNLVYLPVRHNEVGPSRSPTGLGVFCPSTCLEQPILTPFGGVILS